MKYRVSGNQAVLGNAPGTEFDADLNEVMEARLLAGGAIERVGGKAPQAPAEPASDTEE